MQPASQNQTEKNLRRKNSPIRVVAATSLFDGHDASINIMRRIMQSRGFEIIHLGHNRSVDEIVQTALQEDAVGVALTSYQGGHMEFFKYMVDRFAEESPTPIRCFGGGGGVILPSEIRELEDYGVHKIFSPEDGRRLGLTGMIDSLVEALDYNPYDNYTVNVDSLSTGNTTAVAKMISWLEDCGALAAEDEPGSNPDLEGGSGGSSFSDYSRVTRALEEKAAGSKVPVIGITGTGGAGKSSLTDEWIRRFKMEYPDKKLALVAVDPSRSKTGGALLGDRLRMNSIYGDNVFMRSVATRQSNASISNAVQNVLNVYRAAGFDLIILETSGIGQSSHEVAELADVNLYVMTPEYGAATQLEKIDMLDYAHFIAVNKFDRPAGEDALMSVRKQFRRNHNLFDAPDDALPVFGTICSRFNDNGMNGLYRALTAHLQKEHGFDAPANQTDFIRLPLADLIAPERIHYLADIARTVRDYNTQTEELADLAEELYRLEGAQQLVDGSGLEDSISASTMLQDLIRKKRNALEAIEGGRELLDSLGSWNEVKERYNAETYEFKVRGKTISISTGHASLAGTRIPKVALPRETNHGSLTRYFRQENLPGSFPYTAGLFPFKREGEDPTRMFAGEGGPEQTNRRFHFLSKGQKSARLSTAFDSVTLYGEDPAKRPDIFGKIGNSGVSICSLDDMKKLYSGFDLGAPTSSVSMTINGPAPVILAFFLNAAIDQAVEKHLLAENKLEEARQKINAYYKEAGLEAPRYSDQTPDNALTLEGTDTVLGLGLLGLPGNEFVDAATYESIKKAVLSSVRGTVQADILKEDQAQNTCIFSTEFALKMMGDIQEYFSHNSVRNFYSVSVSGYHMAEAGCNPITQLAFTLANGFTYVEYFLSRGLPIDAFAPNLSFFFSNGIDAEYAVIGRVARRLWSKAVKYRYRGSTRSQMLKYHIQTSGRSLHAQEIDFNDIRTTLQALYAIYDNCNSLHTNAYDEAVTTPTEESVRRAVAIQLIINRELGLNKNENPLQGSYIIDELTDLVEEAVVAEFDRISRRGGVLAAMENIYQRNRIQDESMEYEQKKMSGELPIIGVNTFLNPDKEEYGELDNVVRSSEESRNRQIQALDVLKQAHTARGEQAIAELRQTALNGGNIFERLLETAKYCSLGQITGALYECGGQYRRNL